ncbi:MAG: hypothetical protein V9G29_05650 [Burkholderiaceae bacterium]
MPTAWGPDAYSARAGRVGTRRAPLRLVYLCGAIGAVTTCSQTEVKICGIKTADVLDAAIAAGADYIGLVFFPPSPRYLTPHAAQALADRARGRVKIVALVVDPDDALLDEIVQGSFGIFCSFTARRRRSALPRLRAARGCRSSRPSAWRAAMTQSGAGFTRRMPRSFYSMPKPPKDGPLPGGQVLLSTGTISRR